MSRYRSGDEPVPGYRLAEFLGRGGNSEVWKAIGPGRVEIALKFLGLDSRQGLKEFKSIGLVKGLRHPNLVPILGLWLRDPAGNVMGDTPPGGDAAEGSVTIRLGGAKDLVIAMGLGEMNLARRAELDRPKGGIPVKQLLRYFEGAARGIDFLHEPIHPPARTPILHCGIKPENLLIVGGEVQVGDYGVARALESDPSKAAVGSPVYAAPELINNDPGPQTDQYALAIAYFELRTGRVPFDRSKALVANLTGTLDLAPLDPRERAVIRRATSQQPARRYPTTTELVEDLKGACDLKQSRSGVIGRPAAGAQSQVPVPALSAHDNVEETLAVPRQVPRALLQIPDAATPVSTWADDTKPVPALAAPRHRWLWPVLGAALLLIGGAAGAYFAMRTSPETTPSAPSKTSRPTP